MNEETERLIFEMVERFRVDLPNYNHKQVRMWFLHSLRLNPLLRETMDKEYAENLTNRLLEKAGR